MSSILINKSKEKNENENSKEPIYYSITGRAAHLRIKPLLPPHWIDKSPYNNSHNNSSGDTEVEVEVEINSNHHSKLQFIWENAPRSETKPLRNTVSCYSHLPSGIDILDDKWILGRIFTFEQRNRQELETQQQETDKELELELEEKSRHSDSFAPLETHCFRGRSGLEEFYHRMQATSNANATANATATAAHTIRDEKQRTHLLHDLDPEYNIPSRQISASEPDNTWVIKDANSNGFGGIWIMNIKAKAKGSDCDSSSSASMLLDKEQSPLCENHRYVAQKYTWPPVLFQRRKCHIRVYAVMVNGQAFVHKRCFLHVANEEFSCNSNSQHEHAIDDDGIGENDATCEFDPAVHITNCCANSHDPSKFAGEILADLSLGENAQEDECWIDGQKVIPLHKYYPSIVASVQVLAKNAMSYVQGGERNRGFEYLGLDFILSNGCGEKAMPIAYLLEVNCPPSQDTATGLGYAEDLHDEVLRDLMRMWVIPAVEHEGDFDGRPVETYGWDCVYKETTNEVGGTENAPMVPSKAAILNKIRWGIFERRMKKADDIRIASASEKCSEKDCSLSADDIAAFARKQFPYFSTCNVGDEQNVDTERKSKVFLENAGGSQVPSQVIDCMVESLSHRHRSVIGQTSKDEARKVALTLLGGSHDRHKVFLGANASSMFENLARCFVDRGSLKEGDEIILASENHTANTIPWIKAAGKTGARILWWTQHPLSHNDDFEHSTDFNELLSVNTRLVCLSHSSNILGSIRDIRLICEKVRQKCPRAHIIIDGVASAPHVYPAVDYLGVDWYCVSFHKLFGPHLGAMVGRTSALDDILKSETSPDPDPYTVLEHGTLNYEGCNGIIGLGRYFSALAEFGCKVSKKKLNHNVSQVGDDPIQRCGVAPIDLSAKLVAEAYRRINRVEKECLEYVMECLLQNPLLRVIGDKTRDLPIISFVHKSIPSEEIVDHCYRHNICIRFGAFLTTDLLQKEFDFATGCGGIVRASFCHYNTMDDARHLMATLRELKYW